MKSTTNYGLNKPEPTDYYDVEHFNDNFDKIDKELKVNQEHREDKENPHNVNAKHIGLEKVTNTSDEEKPVSKAQRKALEELETNVKAYTDKKITPLSEKVDNSVSVSFVTGTNPTATNSTDGKVIYLKNGGYTEQKTLSGKNLCDLSKVTDGYMITWNTGALYTSSSHFVTDYIEVEPSTTYTIQGFLSGDENWYYDENKNPIKSISGATFTTPSDCRYIRLTGTLSTKGTQQVELGGVATEFEEFSGGTASPNPDYPQEIKGLGEYADINVEFTLNGSVAKTASNIPCTPNMKYIIECDGADSIEVNQYDESGTLNSDWWIYEGVDKLEFVAQGYSFTITLSGATDINNISVKVYAVAVKTVWKNLLKVNTTDYSLTDNGIKNNGQGMEIGRANLKAGKTYSISLLLMGKPTTDTSLVSKINNVDNGNISFVGIHNFNLKVKNTRTYTATKDCVFAIQMYGNTNIDIFEFQLQVEEGITATPYEPYTETQALIPISAPLYDGDYIEVYADGSGEIVRKNKTLVLDGDENFGHIDEWTNKSAFQYDGRISDAVFVNGVYTKANLKCSHLQISTPGAISSMSGISAIGQGNYGIYLSVNGITSTSDLKAWLAENPTTVLYKLATPTTEPLTAEQVAEFKKLQTFNEVTHITADGEVTIRYYCDTDSGETVGMLQEMVESNKNKLANLEGMLPIGSIIRIDEYYDTIPSYGTWQYLGTSALEYNNGSAVLLITKVYKRIK